MKRRIGWALWLLAAAALYIMENNAGTRTVLIASCLLPLLSCGMAAFSARRMTVELSMDEACAPGEDCGAVLTVGGLLPLAEVSAAVECMNCFTGERTAAQLTLNGNGRHAMAAQAAHMGWLEIRTVCRVQDMLGFGYGGTVTLQGGALARPVLPETPAERGSGGSTEADQRRGNRALDEPSPELRAYQPGDPLRSIHWKASQKLDKLLVRPPEKGSGEGCMLVLDASGMQLDPAPLEQLGVRFLAASAALTLAGVPHEAVWFSADEQLRQTSVSAQSDADRLCLLLLQRGVSAVHAPADGELQTLRIRP